MIQSCSSLLYLFYNLDMQKDVSANAGYRLLSARYQLYEMVEEAKKVYNTNGMREGEAEWWAKQDWHDITQSKNSNSELSWSKYIMNNRNKNVVILLGPKNLIPVYEY